MTALVYISMPYGAYPHMYEEILSDKDIKIKESWLNEHECYFIENVIATYELTKEEIDIIDFVVEQFKDYGSKKIVDYMHKEEAHKKTKLFDIISYEYAHSIKIYENFN